MTTNGSNRATSDSTQDSPPGNGRLNDSTCDPASDIGEFGGQMLSELSQTIEGEIIPRLMLAFDSFRSSAKSHSDDNRLVDNVDEFVRLLLTHDATVATNYVSTLRTDGVPLSALYLDLLAPAAKRLGVMWEEDACSFTDVTIGVCRMHQVLLEFSRCFDASERTVTPGRNALVAPVPGEQHTFGLFMVMEFLRRGGWNCFSGPPASSREFLRLARSQDFEMIGISVSSDRHIDTAADLIGRFRRASRNKDTVILAGGKVFLDNPELAVQVGADAMAADGRDAVHKANKLCRQKGESAG